MRKLRHISIKTTAIQSKGRYQKLQNYIIIIHIFWWQPHGCLAIPTTCQAQFCLGGLCFSPRTVFFQISTSLTSFKPSFKYRLFSEPGPIYSCSPHLIRPTPCLINFQSTNHQLSYYMFYFYLCPSLPTRMYLHGTRFFPVSFSAEFTAWRAEPGT